MNQSNFQAAVEAAVEVAPLDLQARYWSPEEGQERMYLSRRLSRGEQEIGHIELRDGEWSWHSTRCRSTVREIAEAAEAALKEEETA
jgi:hypothetical protein